MKENFTGKILVAHPQLQDDYFTKAVILIIEHNEQGALGFVINHKPLHKISDATDEFGANNNFAIYKGGPVNEHDIHYLHCRNDVIKDGKFITENLYWNGNNADVFTTIKNKKITQQALKFFHGYCGWDEGLLEQEIAEKTWLLCKTKATFVIQYAVETMWDKCLEEMEFEDLT